MLFLFLSNAGCIKGLGRIEDVPNSRCGAYSADATICPITEVPLTETDVLIEFTRKPVSDAGG